MSGLDARKRLLIVAAMPVYSFAGGIGMGASLGWGLALAVHIVPEGLATSLVLAPRGVSVARTAWWSVFSSLPQPLWRCRPSSLSSSSGRSCPTVWASLRGQDPAGLVRARAGCARRANELDAAVVTASGVGMLAFQVLIR